MSTKEIQEVQCVVNDLISLENPTTNMPARLLSYGVNKEVFGGYESYFTRND